MTRKLVALLLVVSMVFCMFAGCAFKQEMVTTTTVEMDGYDITVEETASRRTASATVEGIPMKCEHNFNTDEYWLYINEEEPIQLEVAVLDNNLIAISEVGTQTILTDDMVAGQFVLTLSWAVPALIVAAKALICTAVGVTATATVCVAADAIGNVIGGVRSSSRTYYSYRTIDVSAADAIRYGRLNRTNAYFEAYLSNNTVYIGKQISQWSAVWRLERGYDVFATSAFAAGYACLQASTVRGKDIPNHTSSSEGYYPHYHPLGRRWVNNPSSAPHCWYPY